MSCEALFGQTARSRGRRRQRRRGGGGVSAVPAAVTAFVVLVAFSESASGAPATAVEVFNPYSE